MIKSHSLKYMLIVLVFIACDSTVNEQNSSKHDEHEGLITLRIDPDIKHELSDKNFLKKIQLISLETNDSSLIGQISKLIVYKGKLWILDKFQSRSLFCFSMSGEFIHRIHRSGKGPGEYILPEDFTIFEDKITIYDNFRKMKINYDLNGHFINETPLSFSIRNVAQEDENTLLIKPDESYIDPETDFNLLVTNNLVTKIYYKDIPGVTLGESIFSVNKAFSRYDDHFLFTYGFNDTINHYQSKAIRPFLYVDFGRHKIPYKIAKTKNDEERDELFSEENEYAGYLMNLSENKKYITCAFDFFHVKGDRNLIVYSKVNATHRTFSSIYRYTHEARLMAPLSVHDEQFISIAEFESDDSFGIDTDNPTLAFYSIDF